MHFPLATHNKVKSALCVLLLAGMAAVPGCAFEWPLSPDAIREAYFLGARQAGLGREFLASYTHTIPALKVGIYTSSVRIETPFYQVALSSTKTLGYSAQDAVRDFYGKPAVLRMHFEICYKSDASPRDSIKIEITQNQKQISPTSDRRSGFFAPADKRTRVRSIGELAELEFSPDAFDSSALRIRIGTPDGQHAETEFDLSQIR